MIDFVIGIGVAVVVIAIIVNNIVKLKRGETGCSSGCSGCSSSSSCSGHTEDHK